MITLRYLNLEFVHKLTEFLSGIPSTEGLGLYFSSFTIRIIRF